MRFIFQYPPICFATLAVMAISSSSWVVNKVRFADHFRSSHRRCSMKKVLLTISQNSQNNTCDRVSFLIKLQVLACNIIKKETVSQAFSCDFCKIFENAFFTDYLGSTWPPFMPVRNRKLNGQIRIFKRGHCSVHIKP